MNTAKIAFVVATALLSSTTATLAENSKAENSLVRVHSSANALPLPPIPSIGTMPWLDRWQSVSNLCSPPRSWLYDYLVGPVPEISASLRQDKAS